MKKRANKRLELKSTCMVLTCRYNAQRCKYLFARHYASVMELVDMTDSKSVAFGRGGSSPPTGTNLGLIPCSLRFTADFYSVLFV